MTDLFVRSKLNPILKPKPKNWWEAKKLYNPGAIFYNGKHHLFYRAVGDGKNWQSVIGYAVSEDGENFQRFNEPLMVGNNNFEKRGLEDPRITKIEDTFYMAHAAYDGTTPRLCIATSKDLKVWQKRGPALSNWALEKAGGIYLEWDQNGNIFRKKTPTEWSKSGGIFPEKINGKFLMLFGEYRVWLATSDDGINWLGEQTTFLEPRSGDYFDNTFVEMGPPPIKTERGWLVLYHGVNQNHWYQIGFILLDLNNPKKILFRSKEPIFKPEKDYELSGVVDVLPGGLETMQKMTDGELKTFLAENIEKNTMPKVTFCCGAVVVNDVLRIFYGAGDLVIGTATAKLSELLKLAK